jgi:hypothetical protein
MKYKVELSYVYYQTTKPWWSKIEIESSNTKITKKRIEMDMIKRNIYKLKGEKKVKIKIFLGLMLLLPHLQPN